MSNRFHSSQKLLLHYPEGMQLNKLNIIKHKYNGIKLMRMRIKQI